MNEQRLIERLQQLPDAEHRADWADVVNRAQAGVSVQLDAWAPASEALTGRREVRSWGGLRRRGLAGGPVRAGGLVVAVAAVALLVLAWPFGSHQASLLDRARAAVGSGPVLHVTLRGEWGGTLVDLTSGGRTPIYGEDEFWFDTSSGQTHEISRLGTVVQDEELSTPKKPAAELAALGREYKQALESGTAQIAAEDTLDGKRVVWVTIHSELLPDVSDGKDHEWAQQVAVSKQTFKPVAVRETRDGQPGPGTLQRVIDLQMVPRDDANFTTSQPSRDGTAFRLSRDAISDADAIGVLGRIPLWLGSSYDGLPLAQTYRETVSAGHRNRVRLTGAKEAAAVKCSHQPAAGDCLGALGLSSVEVRPDGVYTSEGPIEWSDEQTNLVLFYGSVGDDPSTFRQDSVPLLDKPYASVTESTRVSQFRRGAGAYVPPQGSVFLTAGGKLGYLQDDGLQIGIEAMSEDAVIAAARSLTPMTR